MRISVLKPETNPPGTINRNGPLSFSFAFQRVQSNALQRADLVERSDAIKQSQKNVGAPGIQPAEF
jgi:hypothetical protein